MNKNLFTISLVLIMALIACDQALPRTDAAAIQPTPQITGAGAAASDAVLPATTAGSTKLNPAHGMPGHRCDIPVGQPLNSAPGLQTKLPATAVSGQPMQPISGNATLPSLSSPSAISPAQSAQPVIAPTATVQPVAGQASASGLNPAHGQPGHRCDIPVGASLSSPPGKVNNSVVQTNSAPAGALNPKHGEPGHRCDIPVGSPLNSKPK